MCPQAPILRTTSLCPPGIFCTSLLFFALLQFPSSCWSTNDEFIGRTTRSPRMPEALMNPVYRQQMRQRLAMLNTLRRKAAFGNGQNGPRAFSPVAAAAASSLPIPAHLALNHHRNCFFSPINCHLPVMAAVRPPPSAKRRIVYRDLYRPNLPRMAKLGRAQRQQRVWGMSPYEEKLPKGNSLEAGRRRRRRRRR